MVAGIVYSFHHSVLKRVSFVQEEEKSVKDQRWEKEVLWRAFNDRQMLGDKTSGEKTFLRDAVYPMYLRRPARPNLILWPINLRNVALPP